MAQTQTPFFLNYSVNRGTYLDKRGMPSSETYSVIQDKLGFIWVSTDAGVVRYDGYRLRIFTVQDGLSDNTVFGLHEDDQGRIWCRTLSGKLCYFSNEKQRFYTLPCNDALQKIIGNRSLIQLEVDLTGCVWLVDNDLGQIKIKAPYRPKDIELITGEKKETIYLVKNHKKTLLKLGPHDGEFRNVRFVDKKGVHDTRQRSKVHACIRVCDRGDSTCFSVGETVYITENHKVIDSVNAGASIIALQTDHRGSLWVGTIEKGIFIYNTQRNKKEEPLHLFGKESVSDIYEDSEKGIWFTTLKNGLFYFPYPNALVNYSDMMLVENTRVYTVKRVGDRILAGKSNGDLMVVNPVDLSCKVIPFEPRPGTVGNSNAILNIENTGKDEVLIQGNCTYFLKPSDYSKREEVCQFRRSMSEFPFSNLYTWGHLKGKKRPQIMHSKFYGEFNKDTVFCGGSNALLFFRKGERLIDHVIAFKEGRINSAYVAKPNHVWLGSTNGLYLLKDTTYSYYGDSLKILKSRIEYVCGLKDGRLILATKWMGLLLWNPSQPGKLDMITTKNGLPSNLCRHVFMENDSMIWVSTNRGLCQLDLKHKKVHFNYTMNLGLPSDEINACYVDDKQIWVASSHGLTCINRKEAFENKAPPRIYISSVRLNDTPIARYHFGPTYVYQCPDISYNPQRIIVDFVGLSMKLPGSCTYLYRLKELQDAWTTTSNTSIEFNFLNPGHYHLEIYAVSPAGVKSRFPVFLEFRVLAPFWQKTWFIALVVFLFVVLVFLLFRFRLNRVRARTAKNATLNRTLLNLKLKALRAQMNPHFTFNVMNSIQHFILERDEESAQRYLSKFSKLIRIILQHSEEENIPLSDEVKALELYLELEQMRFEKNFEYSIVIDPSIDMVTTRIPSMLIQPYVENAIKHGISIMEGKGRISLTIENKGHELLCVIEDNGVGRAVAAERKKEGIEHRSFGTSITKERLSVINAIHNIHLTEKTIDLKNEAGEVFGTRVEIHIPAVK